MWESLISLSKVLIASLTLVAVTSSPVSASLNSNTATSLSTSRNWAGYVASGGKFTSVTGTWTVPTVEGGSKFSADATWVGIGGVQSRDLIQSGTQATIGRNGQVVYQIWIEMLPGYQKILSMGVNAGDSVSVSLTQQTGNLWQIDVRNNTSGKDYQTQVNYNSSLSSAEWIEEAPSSNRGIIPLDNFGTVQFSNASTTKDGQQLSISQAGGKLVTMGSMDQILASVSDLSSDGTTFSINRSDLTNVSQSIPQTFTSGRSYQVRFRSFPGNRFFNFVHRR